MLPPKVASSWILATPSRVRDPELIYVKPSQTRASYYRTDPSLPTVLTLGDSLTEGFPVRPSRSYPSDLRRKLARRGERVNVVNLGFGDSGPDQQLGLFRRYVVERGYVHPDVVVWQLYVNDLWDNVLKAVYTIGPRGLELLPAGTNWMYRRQLFFDLTPLPRRVKLESRIYGYALQSAEHWSLAQVPDRYATDPQRWALDKIRLEVAAMEEHAKQRGFRSYYVLVPPQSRYVAASERADVTEKGLDESYAEIRSVVASLPGYIELDFGPARGVRAPRRYYVDGSRDVSTFGNRHLNEAGYRFVARRVGARLLHDRATARDPVPPATPLSPR